MRTKRRTRVMGALIGCAVLAGLVPAPATEGFVAVGFIARQNPAGKHLDGMTEATNPCGRPHPVLGDTQGMDGWWIALPAGAEGRRARLRSDALDADVWFYRSDDGACTLVEGPQDPAWNAMASKVGPDEDGAIPAGADHAVVNVVLGGNVSFVFSID